MAWVPGAVAYNLSDAMMPTAVTNVTTTIVDLCHERTPRLVSDTWASKVASCLLKSNEMDTRAFLSRV